MERNSWSVPELLQLSGGYWATCALHAAVRVDVFSPLDGTSLTSDEVASVCHSDCRAMELLLTALAALGLIEKNSDEYSTTRFSSQFLVPSSPDYLGHILLHHHHLMPGWASLHESIHHGGPVRASISHSPSAAERESFLLGMYNLASLIAPHIASVIDLRGCRRLLDLGGGPGTYAVHFCRQNPELLATVYDLPLTRFFAEGTVERFGLADRIYFSAGDYHTDPIPDGFDAAWLSHILHSEGPAECRQLLLRAAEAINPGGRLLIQEFILNDAKTGPVFPALFSLNMLLGTESGRSYSEEELCQMLQDIGFMNVGRLEIELPNGAGIICGIRG